jgi:hypothetical protein
VSAEAERLAEEEQALRYRAEAAEFRTEAMARYARSPEEAKALEARAADLIVLAASIERHVRGLPALPAAGLTG